MKTRHILMGAVLVALLALRIIDRPDASGSADVVAVTRRATERMATRSASEVPQVERVPAGASQPGLPVRSLPASEPIDIFAPVPPPAPVAPPPPPVVKAPPAPPPPPPPPPTAPPLPFSALGAWTEDGKTTAFLSGPQGTVAARKGDVINASYRVESVAQGMVQLTYLPLNQLQTLTWSTAR